MTANPYEPPKDPWNAGAPRPRILARLFSAALFVGSAVCWFFAAVSILLAIRMRGIASFPDGPTDGITPTYTYFVIAAMSTVPGLLLASWATKIWRRKPGS